VVVADGREDFLGRLAEARIQHLEPRFHEAVAGVVLIHEEADDAGGVVHAPLVVDHVGRPARGSQVGDQTTAPDVDEIAETQTVSDGDPALAARAQGNLGDDRRVSRLPGHTVEGSLGDDEEDDWGDGEHGDSLEPVRNDFKTRQIKGQIKKTANWPFFIEYLFFF